MSGHHKWPPPSLDTCYRCGKTFQGSLENDFKCPRCGYTTPEMKILAQVFKKKKR